MQDKPALVFFSCENDEENNDSFIDSFRDDNEKIFKIFGQTFDVSIFQSDIQSIFDLIRSNLNKFEWEAVTSLNLIGSIEISIALHKFRRDFVQFFKALDTYLRNLHDRNCQNFVVEKELKNISSELKGLLLDVGHLHKLPVFKSTKNKKNPVFVYFHLCLDFWWHSAMIFSHISQFWPNSDYFSNVIKNVDSNDFIDTNLSLFVKMLVLDLCMVGASFYPQETSNADHDWLFPCSCVEKFWCVLKRLIDDLSKNQRISVSFSNILRSAVVHLTSETRPNDVSEHFSDQFSVTFPFTSVKVADKRLFCWHLVQNLQRIKTENDTENVRFLNESVEYLIKTTIVVVLNEQKTFSIDVEQKIRRYMTCFLRFSTNFERISSAPEMLLDPFCRHINESFFGGRNLDELTVNEKISAKTTLILLKRLIDDEEISSNIQQRSSFELFLRILATHCAADQKLAKIIRGRIFSKFHPGRVESLSERGLMNFFDLFLLLAYKTGLNEVTEKIMEYFSNADLMDAKFFHKTKIIMKSFFVLSMMHQEKRSDGSICTSQLRRLFDILINQYNASRFDVVVRRDLWSCLHLFVDLTRELIEGICEVDCGESNLIDVIHIDSYLKLAKSNDDLKSCHLRSIFDLWRTLADRANSIAEKIFAISDDSTTFPDRLTSIFDAICTKIIPVCKQFMSSSNVAVDYNWELFYSLTMSVYFHNDRRTTDNNEFIDLFDVYVWNSNVSGVQACRYLAKLSSVVVLDSSTIVGAWLRCLLTMTDDDATLKILTEFVSKSFLAPLNVEIPSEIIADRKETFKFLCRTVGETMSIATTSTWRPIFERPMKLCVEILKNLEPKDVFLHCNSLLTHLIENCAYILHRRDDPRSVLKAILEQNVLFNGIITSSSDKEFKYSAINNSFPQIIRGILKSSSWQADAFLRNSLYESYKLAFERLSTMDTCRPSSTSFKVNFLMEPLKETCNKESAKDIDVVALIFRKNYVEKAVCDLLDRYAASKQNLIITLILTFYSNLTESTKCGSILVDEWKNLLPKTFTIWLRCDDSSTSMFVDTLVNTVCCRLLQIDGGSAVVVGSIKQILHSHLRQHSERVMKIMRNLHRNAKIRLSLNLKEIYSLELIDIERKSGGAVGPSLWTVAEELA